MLRFGTVTNINPLTAKARVQFSDDVISYWLSILQNKTYKDKFYSIVDIGEQVVCLMDENCEDGVILGAIYTDLNYVPGTSNDQYIASFSDNSFVEYNKDSHTLTVLAKNIRFVGDIEHNGKLTNTDGITSSSDITDKTSSMQAIRDVYNAHSHTGNQGSPTSTPDGSMK